MDTTPHKHTTEANQAALKHMPSENPTLRRAVTLPLLVLYGLGVTIGAGIYVLIGEAAGRAGVYAPSAFLLAAAVVGFSACSFSELSGRYPLSAGEAVYVQAGFHWPPLTLLTGLLLVMTAVVSAAAITLGGTGYIRSLVDLPATLVIIAIVLIMGAVAAWGIVESVAFAAVFTVIEILGLLALIVAGFATQPELVFKLPDVIPSITDTGSLTIVFTTSLIAFFAFVGFDDMVNLVEETRNPARTVPLGIFLTLAIATTLYFFVAAVAVLSVPPTELARSQAPISMIFGRLTGASPLVITLIAIVATLNGIIIQIVMASRVLYGLGNTGRLPGLFARVNPITRTPLLSTILVTGIVLVLALYIPIGTLVERTTQTVLVVFSLVNASLLSVKLRKLDAPEGIFKVPVIIPLLGLATCLLLLIVPPIIEVFS